MVCKMSKNELLAIPKVCPVTGESLYVSELTSAKGEVVIRGKFALPEQDELSEEMQDFLVVFLRARGVISTMEKELGISYPTVRNKIDALLEAMKLEPFKHDKKSEAKAEDRAKILKQLEDGEISAAEAKEMLKKAGAK